MPYLKFLASIVPETWRGPKSSKVSHVTISRTPDLAFCLLVPLVIYMHAKFEVSRL